MSFIAGSIIRLRNRLWRVDDIQELTFTATPINGNSTDKMVFISELEKVENASFAPVDPDNSGDLANQTLLVNACRFELVHGSAPFVSLNRSSVVPYNYQLVPLVMALEKKNCRMLLADDVGLGKTVEAGLILNEYLQRGKIRRILILTPASLKEQWQESLEYFFHLDSQIISSLTRKEFEKELPPGVNPWQYFNTCIASLDYAKLPDVKYAILNANWDFLVVDEIHSCARPHSARNNDHQMQRYELVSEVAAKIDNVLFLSATPHNGYTDSFASILEMIHRPLVEYHNTEIIIHKEKARFNVCQRNRKSLVKWYQSQDLPSPFPERNMEDVILTSPYHHPYIQLMDHVEHYGDQLIERDYDSSRKQRVASWVALHLQKRGISSPRALEISILNRLEQKIPLKEMLREETDYEGSVSDLFSDERTSEEETNIRVDQSLVSDEEKAMLTALLEECQALKTKDDLKLLKIRNEIIPELFSCESKIILFTKYKDTLDYLALQLSKEDDFDVFTLHGDLSLVRRKEVFLEFERSEKAVLIATDVISEGLNLQHLASNMIHYELPWNPNRLEQRNGRIDRIGQRKETVQIRTLILEKTMEFDILDLLLRKARTIGEDRGYSSAYFGDEDTLAAKVQEARRSKKKRAADDRNQLTLTFGQDTHLTKDALYKSYIDPFDKQVLDRIARESFYDEMNINLPEIDKRIKRSLDIMGSREMIRNFVISAIIRLNGQVLQTSEGIFRLIIKDKRLILPNYGSIIEPVTFDPEKALAHPGLIMLEPGNPLIRRMIEIIKADFFETEGSYGRTAYFYSDRVKGMTVIYHILARFTIGIGEKRVLEELVQAGIDLFTDRQLTPDESVSLTPSVSTTRPLPDQLREYYRDALNHPSLKSILQHAIDERRRSLINERLELQQKILKETYLPDESQWIREIAVVEEAGHDILAITAVLPLIKEN